MHIASFAGIAPVNNPVIAVAVIMDNPKGDYYGASVSAPVFSEVAQQVLEYLGVPHDIDVRAPRAPQKSDARVAEDEAREKSGEEDLKALYAAANDLPSDDPLRNSTQNQNIVPGQTKTASQTAAPSNQSANSKTNPVGTQANSTVPQAQPLTTAVMLVDPKSLRVPSLIGLPVRRVIEQAAAVGLEVHISGSGTVREQAPAPGTMVAPGTQVVVRCGR